MAEKWVLSSDLNRVPVDVEMAVVVVALSLFAFLAQHSIAAFGCSARYLPLIEFWGAHLAVYRKHQKFALH